MTKSDSKRLYERHDCCLSISCARFNSTDYFQGRMLNFSQSGLYFECDSALPTGMSILIRVQKNLAADSACEIREGFRWMALGEVRWCEEFISEGSAYYGVGVKYYLPDFY